MDFTLNHLDLYFMIIYLCMKYDSNTLNLFKNIKGTFFFVSTDGMDRQTGCTDNSDTICPSIWKWWRHKKYFLLFFTNFNLLMFHNNTVKISESWTSGMLKICIQLPTLLIFAYFAAIFLWRTRASAQRVTNSPGQRLSLIIKYFKVNDNDIRQDIVYNVSL